MRSPLRLAACGVAACSVVAAWLGSGPRVAPGGPGAAPIHATLETVVPAHNDLFFRYLLENQTDSEYRLGDESGAQILTRSRSTGALESKAATHISGEFPLVVPARGRAHFALIWTADQEIDAAKVTDVVERLAVDSFVIIDTLRDTRIELPVESTRE